MNKKDFFISYSDNDREWADWIAEQLEMAGYTLIYAEWDFRPGNNFVHEMQKATRDCERVLMVLSQHFIDALYTQPEWQQAFAKDPTGEKGLLVPVRIQNSELPGLLNPLIYIDFYKRGTAPPSDDKDLENDLRGLLLRGVERGRRKPERKRPLPVLKVDRQGLQSPEMPTGQNMTNPLPNPVLKDYLSHVLQQHCQLDIAFLPQGKAINVHFPVADIFISLRARARDLKSGTPDTQNLETDLRDYRDNTDPWEFDKILEKYFELPQQTLLVLGKPGSGKTTLLRRIAYAYSAYRQKSWESQDRIPFFLSIKHIVPLLAQNTKLSLNQVIATSLNGKFQEVIDASLAGGGSGLLLLDAVDEVTDTQQRKSVMEWIKSQQALHRHLKFIISSRIHGFNIEYAPENGTYIAVVVDDLNEAQQRDFLSNWFRHIIKWYQEKNPFVKIPKRQYDEVASELGNTIAEDKKLSALAASPLLLSMLAVIAWWRFIKQEEATRLLPRRRSDIYSECFRLFVNEVECYQWDTAREVSQQKPESAFEILMAAAWALQTELQATEDDEESLLLDKVQLVASTYRLVGPIAGVVEGQIEAVFKFSHLRTPLLVEPKLNQWGFLHKTLQEYLACRYLLTVLRTGDKQCLQALLESYWGQAHWRVVWELLLETLKDNSAESCAIVREQLLPPLRQRFTDDPDVMLTNGGRGWLNDLLQNTELPASELIGLQQAAWKHLPHKNLRVWQYCHRLLTRWPVSWLTEDRFLQRLEEHNINMGSGDINHYGRMLLLGAELFAQQKPEAIVDYFVDTMNNHCHPVMQATAALAMDYWEVGEKSVIDEMLVVSLPESEFYRGTKKGDPLHREGLEDSGGPYRINSFAMARFPVTNFQYARYLTDIGENPDFYSRNPFEPAVKMKRFEAEKYSQWLSGERSRYALPTEAQWERAARGPAQWAGQLNRRCWPWGDSWQSDYCNSAETHIATTTIVGAFPQGASPEGVLDMAGNVWEWCADKYTENYYQRGSVEASTEGSYHVVRGGAFYVHRLDASCVYRGDDVDYRGNDVGFRVARIL